MAANIREKLSFHNRSVEGLIHTEHSECESEVAVRRMKAPDIKRKISLKDSLSPWVVPRGSTLDLRVTDRKSGPEVPPSKPEVPPSWLTQQWLHAVGRNFR